MKLARVEHSDLGDGLAFAAAARRGLVRVEARIIPVEVEQQLVGEEVVHGNSQLLGDGIDERVETARNQIDFLVLSPQILDEVPRKSRDVIFFKKKARMRLDDATIRLIARRRKKIIPTRSDCSRNIPRFFLYSHSAELL